MMGWGRGVAAGGPTHIVADAHGIDRLEHRNDRRADGGSEQCALLEADVDDHACGGCDERTRIMSGSGGFRERDGAGGQAGRLGAWGARAAGRTFQKAGDGAAVDLGAAGQLVPGVHQIGRPAADIQEAALSRPKPGGWVGGVRTENKRKTEEEQRVGGWS